jgi:hypothetical protein
MELTTSPMHSGLDRPYKESEQAAVVTTNHYLNDVSEFGFWKTKTAVPKNDAGEEEDAQPKKRLFVCVNVYDIKEINPSSESFSARIRIYALWDFDFLGRDDDLSKFGKLAIENGAYYPLKPTEVQQFSNEVLMPEIKFFNAIETTALDEVPSIRAYCREGNGGAAMWNQGYLCTFREHFELQNFPFDSQDLTMELRLDNPRTWDLYDLSIHSVLFYRTALEMAEWSLGKPTIARQNPSHKGTNIKLQVLRKPGYYINNICSVQIMLAILCMSSFALPPDDLGDQISIIITLMLTSVAFKFVIADALPKVTYSTLMDSFILMNMAFLFTTAVICTAGNLYQRNNRHPERVQEPITWYLFLASGGNCLLINGSWLLRIFFVGRENGRHFEEMAVKDGKNWYHCRFGSPFFMPPFATSDGKMPGTTEV